MSGSEDSGEVVASGQALATVARWLGVEDVEATLGEEGLAAEYETQRPQGLGLGAKFLPHSKAVALTMGVEHRLKRKLQQSAERQLREGAELGAGGDGRQQQGQRPQRGGWGRGGGATATLHEHRKHHRQQQQQQQQQAGQQQLEEGGDGSESEGEAQKGRGSKPARSKGLSRADLLSSPQQQKKRKRK